MDEDHPNGIGCTHTHTYTYQTTKNKFKMKETSGDPHGDMIFWLSVLAFYLTSLWHGHCHLELANEVRQCWDLEFAVGWKEGGCSSDKSREPPRKNTSHRGRSQRLGGPVWPADPDHAPVAWSLPKLERARDANGRASALKSMPQSHWPIHWGQLKSCPMYRGYLDRCMYI